MAVLTAAMRKAIPKASFSTRAAVKAKAAGLAKPKKMKKGGFVPFKKKPAQPTMPGDEMETRAKRAKEFETKNGEQEF